MEILRVKKYVLTGGPGVGKSSVIAVFAARGYCIVPETARAVIEEELEKGSDILPWGNLSKFQAIVAQRQLAEENKINAREVFLDRGIIDGCAYCAQGNIEIPQEIIDNGKGRYDGVFLLAPLMHYENDRVRKEEKERQIMLHAMIEKAYRTFGYDVIHVPAVSANERAEFILNIIK